MADDCHFEHDKTRHNYVMDYKILTNLVCKCSRT